MRHRTLGLFSPYFAASVGRGMAALAKRSWTRFQEFFFRQFFHLLLVVIGVGEWACIAWFSWMWTGAAPPGLVHVAAVVAFYLLNRSIVGWRANRRHRFTAWWYRAYAAAAFTALFCFVFLLASGGVWLALRGVLGALSVQALGAVEAATMHEGFDRFFAAAVTFGMGGVGLVVCYGYVFGQRQLRVTELALPMRGLALPPGDPGPRIVQVSDIHVGQNLSLAQLEGFVDRVNALDADLICITGDIADSPTADLQTFFPVLGRLRARHGVVAILGNHDHYAGADRVTVALRRWAGFRVLRDEGVTLDVKGVRLHVIGVDDRGKDWGRGVRSCARLGELIDEAPPGVPVLLLSHRPDLFFQSAEAGVALTLSGHTHGGQLAVPWFGGKRRNLAEFITPFHRGLYERGSSYLYVNSGLGVTGQRIRLVTPREIGVFELRPC